MRTIVGLIMAVVALTITRTAVQAIIPGGVKGLDLKPIVQKSGKDLIVQNHSSRLPGHLVAVIDLDRWGSSTGLQIVTPYGTFGNLVVGDPKAPRPLRVADLPLQMTPMIADIIVNGGKGGPHGDILLLTLQRPTQRLFGPSPPLAATLAADNFQTAVQTMLHKSVFVRHTAAWDEARKQLIVYITASVNNHEKMAGRCRMDMTGQVVEKRLGPLSGGMRDPVRV